jgi:hypothetical protein
MALLWNAQHSKSCKPVRFYCVTCTIALVNTFPLTKQIADPFAFSVQPATLTKLSVLQTSIRAAVPALDDASVQMSVLAPQGNARLKRVGCVASFLIINDWLLF